MTDNADNPTHRTGFEVAIVGMAGRFPGAEDLDRFWQNLCEGIESIKDLTEEEMRASGAGDNALRAPHWVRRARVIEDPDHFDAGFFAVSPREADLIDPQQRVFLESAWAAMEDAGYDPDRIDFPVGVYAGSRFNGYLLNVYSNQSLVQRVGDFQIQISNDKDYIATRTSYKLGLGGPSVTVQSACSTALVAVHLGCQALNAGECDLSLAGGVGIRFPEYGYPYVEGDVGSPDGHVRPFDAKANGTMFGSGVGVVVLKRLDEALEDGDNIHAIIRGSAVTNDGAAKVGFSAPGVDGQYRVVRAAHAVAEVDPETISYVEAHGTGTNMGDPIEVSALTRAFRDSTERRGFCALGSVKGNIGHLGVGAGGASLIKTVLAMKHRQLPPSINFDEPNPQIDFNESPFFVSTELVPWEADGGPLVAGVSAFGIGGTNAHLIVEEAPGREPAPPSRARQVLPLAGRSQAVLETIGADLASHLETHPDLSLADAAYTLQVGRRLHPLRQVVVAADRDEAVAALRGDAPGRVVQGVASGRRPSVAFMFSGQGSQYAGMTRGLYESEPAFRESIDRCAEILEPHLGLDLRTLLYPDEAGAAEAGEQLQQTAYTQPALFAVEVSLAHLWRSWGIEPTAMIGHSIGEYVAAHLAGVFSLEDGLALVAARGRLMQDLPGGDMLAVPLSEEEVEKHLDAQLSVAAVNAEGRCVVSGPADAVAALRERLEADGLACRPLHTSHAFHSPMMEPILGPFAERFSQVELSAPSIPVVSNVTGTWLTEEEATDPGYWARHIRGTVRFAAGVGELLADESRLLLEVGPGNTLTTLARRHSARTDDQPVIPSTRHPKDGDDDLTFLLKSLGQLWIAGAAIDWRSFHGDDRRARVSLPTYPFERQRFWIEAWQEGFSPFGGDATAKKEDIADWCYLPSWKPSLAPRPAEDLRDEPRTWLVFGGDDALTPAMVSALGEVGQRVVTVERGEGFSATDGGYRIAAGEKGDYDALVKALVADGGAPDVILHLWNVTGDRGDLALDRVEDAEQRSFWSQLFLAQALGRQGVDQEMRWVVVSDNLHRVAGERFLCPEKAPLLGPIKVVSLEYPWIECRAVDVVMPDGADQIGAVGDIVDRLIAEATGAGDDLVVALRDGDRWVQGYESTRLEEVADGELMIREGGVYLITGGLGGIGLTFADYLAREHRARLALVGLSAMPERSTWDEWLETHSASDRTSDKIRKVMALEEAGAEVIALSADIADPEQTAAVVAETLERFGALHGIVHAAGLAGGGMVQLKTEEVAARVLSPKIRGTVCLETALAGAGVRPDFVVVCSSTIACVGGIGQVDYTAANSFLDAWAHRQQLRLGGDGGAERTLSINWGAWEEVGMAVAAGIAAGAADLAGGETGHPLLDRCVRETSDQTVYATDFSPERQWVVGEHKILGTPTLPGTSYLEIARAAFVHHASNFEQFDPEAPVEVRDVFFLNPMMIPDGTSREAQITLERSGGEFKFRIATKAGDKVGGEGSWQAHVRGRVMAGEPGEAKTLDLDAIRGRCDRETITFDGSVMNEEGVGVVYWGEHWQSLREIRLGDGEGLALLELPEEIADETREMPLHPALVDVATGIIGFVEEDNYLPLSYGAVKVRKALTPRLYSYLKKRADGSGRETLTVDVTLMSEEGEVLVEIEHFAMKKVGEAAASFQRPAAAQSEKPAATAGGSAADSGADFGGSPAESPKAPVPIAASGILPREGVEVFRRMLSTRLRAPQMIASAKDLRVLIEQTRTIDREQLMAGSGASASRGSHERPSIPTPYVAPRNDVETKLAGIWQDSLGIKEVGVHDNFFDLGGDSVMGIQLISRANEEGLELSPDQLFEHQTIAELAELLGSTGTMAAGPVPLTPYQRRLAGAGFDPSRVMIAEVEVPAEIPDRDAVAEALAALVAAHPALGLRYGGTEATPPEEGEAVRPPIVEAGAAGLEQAAAELAADLDPATGRSVGAAFAAGEGEARLLLVMHRLAGDHRSAGLLARQLSRLLEQIGTGGTPDLAGEAQPFDTWARSLAASAAERSTAEEVSCWAAVAGDGALDPFGGQAASGAEGGLGVESVALDGALVGDLEAAVRPTFNSTLEEELLAAVGRALDRVQGRRAGGPLTLRIERDGRRGADADAFADSVGSFTVAFPLTLDRPADEDPGATLTAVKESLRAVPGVGEGFDHLLGEAEGDGREGLASVAEPAVAFALTAGPVGRPMAPERTLTVVAATGDGTIGLELLYDRSRLDGAAVAELGKEIGAELQALVDTAKGLGDAVFSPSDFPEADLDEDDLAKVLSKLGD